MVEINVHLQGYFWYNLTILQKGGRLFMTGTVKKKMDKGFGFISRDGEQKDLFFHSNDLKGVTFDEIQEGDTVTFEVVNGDRGPSAKNVTRG